MRTLALVICLVATPAVAPSQEPPQAEPPKAAVTAHEENPQTQTEAAQPDPLIVAARDSAIFFRDMFTKAADQMSDEDYVFKPTPEVRSFGQLLAHIADANYIFCSLARGEKRPVESIEKTKTTRADIKKALSESFTYCDEAYVAMTDTKAKTMITFRGKPRPMLAVLFFRTHHAALHYGNVITYMRLRGKIPPSTPREPQ